LVLDALAGVVGSGQTLRDSSIDSTKGSNARGHILLNRLVADDLSERRERNGRLLTDDSLLQTVRQRPKHPWKPQLAVVLIRPGS